MIIINIIIIIIIIIIPLEWLHTGRRASASSRHPHHSRTQRTRDRERTAWGAQHILPSSSRAAVSRHGA